jgi:hypothetical protein
VRSFPPWCAAWLVVAAIVANGCGRVAEDDEPATHATGGAPADSGNEPSAGGGTGGDGAGTGGGGSPESPSDPGLPIVNPYSCPTVVVEVLALERGQTWKDFELRGCCRSDGLCGSVVDFNFMAPSASGSRLPANGCRAPSELDAMDLRTKSSAVFISCRRGAPKTDASIAPDASD